MTTKEKAIAEIDALRIHPEFTVEKIDESLWRINGKFDLYPDKRRIYKVANTQKCWYWKRGELPDKLRDLIKRDGGPKKFNVVYIVGGKEIETLSTDKNWGPSQRIRDNANKSGQYKSGTVCIKPV